MGTLWPDPKLGVSRAPQPRDQWDNKGWNFKLIRRIQHKIPSPQPTRLPLQGLKESKEKNTVFYYNNVLNKRCARRILDGAFSKLSSQNLNDSYISWLEFFLHSWYPESSLYLKSQLGYSKPAQMQGLKLILTHAVTDVLHIRLATWQHSNQ